MDGPDDSVDQRLKITSTSCLLSVILQSRAVKIFLRFVKEEGSLNYKKKSLGKFTENNVSKIRV